MRAIRVLRPAAVLLENVRGLLRQGFQPYFDYLLRQLECPSIKPRAGELWQTHNERVRRHQCSPSYEPEYQVAWRLLDAADFGVPQNRQRVFLVATRIDLPPFRFPKRTHSRAALVRIQNNGEYWERHGVARPKAVGPNGDQVESDEQTAPWVTVREALAGLPEPSPKEGEASLNHWIIPGARPYTGHSGSVLDWWFCQPDLVPFDRFIWPHP
jgi:DNA (cytosine-5)-methyltransferase 1